MFLQIICSDNNVLIFSIPKVLLKIYHLYYLVTYLLSYTFSTLKCVLSGIWVPNSNFDMVYIDATFNYSLLKMGRKLELHNSSFYH
jgi:hypothetical protein